MAEVYGVKPKAFTKEWWPYYWMYYKWHTISAVLVIVCVVVTIVQCTNKEKYDATVNYAGAGYISEETLDELEIAFEELIEDVDGNGEPNVYIQQLNMSANDTNPEMTMALQTKHDISFSENTNHLYIYDKAQAELIMGREYSAELFVSVDEWYIGEYDDSAVIKNDDGVPLAISIKDSKLFDEYGINSDDMYIAIKLYDTDDSTDMASYNNAIAMADAIME